MLVVDAHRCGHSQVELENTLGRERIAMEEGQVAVAVLYSASQSSMRNSGECSSEGRYLYPSTAGSQSLPIGKPTNQECHLPPPDARPLLSEAKMLLQPYQTGPQIRRGAAWPKTGGVLLALPAVPGQSQPAVF